MMFYYFLEYHAFLDGHIFYPIIFIISPFFTIFLWLIPWRFIVETFDVWIIKLWHQEIIIPNAINKNSFLVMIRCFFFLFRSKNVPNDDKMTMNTAHNIIKLVIILLYLSNNIITFGIITSYLFYIT